MTIVFCGIPIEIFELILVVGLFFFGNFRWLALVKQLRRRNRHSSATLWSLTSPNNFAEHGRHLTILGPFPSSRFSLFR